LVEDVVAKDAAKDSDEYQRLTGSVSPAYEGEEAHAEEGNQSYDARDSVVNPLLQVEVVRELSHRSRVPGTVPHKWGVVDESQRLLNREKTARG
jgi:hypothetical protein